MSRVQKHLDVLTNVLTSQMRVDGLVPRLQAGKPPSRSKSFARRAPTRQRRDVLCGGLQLFCLAICAAPPFVCRGSNTPLCLSCAAASTTFCLGSKTSLLALRGGAGGPKRKRHCLFARRLQNISDCKRVIVHFGVMAVKQLKHLRSTICLTNAETRVKLKYM